MSLKVYLKVGVVALIFIIVISMVYRYKSLVKYKHTTEMEKEVIEVFTEVSKKDKVKTERILDEKYFIPCEYNCTIRVR